MAYRRNRQKIVELNDDDKNDLLLGFNLFKNNKDKVSKAKLRCLLFSFAMYKSAPNDINEFINYNYPKQEEFTYEELRNLMTLKNHTTKEKDIDDTWHLIQTKSSFSADKDLLKAMINAGVDTNEKEILEMIECIKDNYGASSNENDTTPQIANNLSHMNSSIELQNQNEIITRDEFKKFINY